MTAELFPKVTIGEELWDKMCAMKKEGGLTKETGVKALNDLVDKHVKGLRGSGGMKVKKHERAELFNALVSAEGSSSELTERHKTRISLALNQILAVRSDLTAADITRAAELYKRKNKNVAFTSMGLAAQWGTLGFTKAKDREPDPLYTEPKFDWHKMATNTWGVELPANWLDVPITIRADLIRLAS